MRYHHTIVHTGLPGPWPHEFPFDPTHGHDQDALLAISPPPVEPGDFDHFWRESYALNEQTALTYTLESVPYPDPRVRAAKLSFSSWGGLTSHAWLLEPTGAPPTLGCVIGHGYGGRDDISPGPWALNQPEDHDVARIFPVARGFHISAMPDIPTNDAARHVVHGIGDKDTYVLRGCVAEQWTCSRILINRHPGLQGRLAYSGGSFGGGLGALMLPWCERFSAAHLSVPTFGHHPLRLTHPCTGSGESVRSYAATHPEVSEVLGYYDAATAAKRIQIPMVASAALFDPGVPPPGQFAVCNALPSGTSLYILSIGHFQHPQVAHEGPDSERWAGAFLRRQLSGQKSISSR